MSIPERLYKIAKFKLDELKERIDGFDTEHGSGKRQPFGLDSRGEANRELDEALAGKPSATTAPVSSNAGARQSDSRLRSPEQIVSGSTGYQAPATSTAPQNDALAYHYKLLGVEPGSDFAAVSGAYNSLAARSDSSRFPAGSPEEKQANEIRARLDASFKILREALDETTRRFDMLEFDRRP